MIRWPGHIKPDQVSDALVANLDMFETFLKAGGASLPGYKIDGLNMLSFFTGKAKRSPRNEYGYFINKCEGIRVGEWKLREAGDETELFNMQYDPDELYNQAKDNPDVVKRLRERMNELAKYAGTTVAGSAK
jgi:arylsulfatase